MTEEDEGIVSLMKDDFEAETRSIIVHHEVLVNVQLVEYQGGGEHPLESVERRLIQNSRQNPPS